MLWTNTCCSHPLNIESQNTPDKITNALVERLNYELRIKTENNIYKLIDKILYRAPSNEIYEEFELDYLFMAKLDGDSEDNNYIYGKNKLKNIINKDEVDDIKFDTIDNILKEMEEHPDQFTPWFKILMKSRGKLMEDILIGKVEYKGFDGKIKNHIE